MPTDVLLALIASCIATFAGSWAISRLIKEREICHQEAQVELHKSMDAYADMTSSLMMENKTREELIERWS